MLQLLGVFETGETQMVVRKNVFDCTDFVVQFVFSFCKSPSVKREHSGGLEYSQEDGSPCRVVVASRAVRTTGTKASVPHGVGGTTFELGGVCRCIL